MLIASAIIIGIVIGAIATAWAYERWHRLATAEIVHTVPALRACKMVVSLYAEDCMRGKMMLALDSVIGYIIYVKPHEKK